MTSMEAERIPKGDRKEKLEDKLTQVGEIVGHLEAGELDSMAGI